MGPHTLRHAFITAALDAGVPLRDVQEAASHADPRTTMRYDNPRKFHQTREFLVRKASEILWGPDRAQAVGWELAVWSRLMQDACSKRERPARWYVVISQVLHTWS